LRINGTFS